MVTNILHEGGELLMLCHRIPYPPDKGDKIRSYQWVRALAECCRLYLVAFVDDPRDWEYAPRLREFCAEVYLVPLKPYLARLRGLPALATTAPITTAYYRDKRIAVWVEELLKRRPIKGIVVYSSAMAQYVSGHCFKRSMAENCRRIIDFVDVDSDKWRQYASQRRGAMAWIYRREAKRLLTYDTAIAQEFDLSIFVSQAEAAFFRKVAGLEIEPHFVTNGVDHLYFSPDPTRASPYPSGRAVVVFTGAMNYWPNVDAVCWFTAQVWPSVREQMPNALFYIVGSHPDAKIMALASDDIVVPGRVADVRPYLQHAAAVIAPMRIARGIQNKVLEGMAMARPVILSSAGFTGIGASDEKCVLLAENAAEFAKRTSEVLLGSHAKVGKAARDFVIKYFDWEQSKKHFVSMLTDITPDS